MGLALPFSIFEFLPADSLQLWRVAHRVWAKIRSIVKVHWEQIFPVVDLTTHWRSPWYPKIACYTPFKKIKNTVLKIVLWFCKIRGLYLINGIIRTKVLDRFANTIVNQNSFQLSGEFLDQRQNLILLNRGNHLDKKRNWITFAQWRSKKSKRPFDYLHISKDVSDSISSGANHWIHGSGLWDKSTKNSKNIYRRAC